LSIKTPEQIGLYIHLPWCIKKCPYCDFNSHQLRADLDENSYIDALINDFEFEITRLEQPRAISSIFIGGGTPSLFSAKSIQRLLSAIKSSAELSVNVEITLEANPGAADESRFIGYRRSGINRLSIGIQSFNENHLKILGRVHGSEQALSAVAAAKAARFDNFNLDLMYCLPDQTVEQARADIAKAISLAPSHISAYHLTIEPNTFFAKQPPILPNDSIGWEIQKTYWSMLEQAGYQKYEISAYSKPGYVSEHNLNYWRFGDYLGIGAGAHGKITHPDGVYRTSKPKHPKQYEKTFAAMPSEAEYISPVKSIDLPLEYMMNKLRLDEGFSLQHFESFTGLDYRKIEAQITKALDSGLLIEEGSVFYPSAKGRLFLDDLLQLFLPENEDLKQCCG